MDQFKAGEILTHQGHPGFLYLMGEQNLCRIVEAPSDEEQYLGTWAWVGPEDSNWDLAFASDQETRELEDWLNSLDMSWSEPIKQECVCDLVTQLLPYGCKCGGE